jgi:hypothetical protein
MYNIPPPQLPIPTQQLLQIPRSLPLLHPPPHLLTQITITQLRDNIGVVFCVVDLVELQDAGRVAQLLEVLDFVVEQLAVDLAFEHLHVDDFYGDGLV